jgi:hypothetical protein
MVDVDGIGAAVRLFSVDTDDLGVVRAPPPVEPGDLLARDHGPALRARCVVSFAPGGRVDYLVEVEEVGVS